MELGAQDAGILPLSWDGFADNGSVAKTGSYKVEVTATIAGQSLRQQSKLRTSNEHLKQRQWHQTQFKQLDISQHK